MVWLLLTLVRRRQVTFAAWVARFPRGQRTFERDIAKLRELGRSFDFELTGRHRGVVRLKTIAEVAEPARKGDAPARDALAAVVDALGDVIANSLRGFVDYSGTPFDRFLRFATPRLIASSEVAETFRQLRDGWLRRAALRFRYPPRSGSAPATERIVEPYLTTYNAGRYYLVGFDTRARTGGWRQYALDRIEGPIVRAHTFVPRHVPAAYRGEDAVGLFKHDEGNLRAPSVRVTIALSSKIAQAVTGRLWQTEQFVERTGDAATISFAVHDVGEAVRWAFGFGIEARVVAPPEAVALARATAAAMLGEYASDAESSVLA